MACCPATPMRLCKEHAANNKGVSPCIIQAIRVFVVAISTVRVLQGIYRILCTLLKGQWFEMYL